MVCFVLFVQAVWPAAARAEQPLSLISDKLSVSASLRVRGEFWDWFEASAGDNDYAYLATVAKFGLKWSEKVFDLSIEAQNTALIGLPSDASAPAPEGALGLGAVYRVHNRRDDDASVFLKQAHLTLKNFGLPGLTLQGGRHLISEGAEVLRC